MPRYSLIPEEDSVPISGVDCAVIQLCGMAVQAADFHPSDWTLQMSLGMRMPLSAGHYQLFAGMLGISRLYLRKTLLIERIAFL